MAPPELIALVDLDKMAAICGFQNVSSSPVGILGLLPLGPKLSCPTTSRYQFSLSVPNSEVEHPVTSSSTTGGAEWVVTSTKSCSSTGSDSIWLNRVVWDHLLVDPRWIAPTPWTTSQWLKVTCSCTVSSIPQCSLPKGRGLDFLVG